jgi:ABC-2 type transport system permease protein
MDVKIKHKGLNSKPDFTTKIQRLKFQAENSDSGVILNPKLDVSSPKNKLSRPFYYLRIWLLMSKNAILVMRSQKLLFFIFLLGKFLRFIFFVSFLFFIVTGSKRLVGYDANQVIFFFITFVLVDTIAQFLFREVYRFRPLVVSGDFDLILIKPISPLFRVLLGGMDIIDLATIPPLILAVYYVGRALHPQPIFVFYYLLLVANALLIATSFHIAVLAFGVITLEINNTIMIYRDLTSMGRFPIDIYREPLRSVLTYVVPVGLMMTYPAKALMGVVSLKGVILSFALGLFVFFLSLRFWNFALRKYTSASS